MWPQASDHFVGFRLILSRRPASQSAPLDVAIACSTQKATIPRTIQKAQVCLTPNIIARSLAPVRPADSLLRKAPCPSRFTFPLACAAQGDSVPVRAARPVPRQIADANHR